MRAAAASRPVLASLRGNSRVCVSLQQRPFSTDLVSRVDPLDKTLSAKFAGRQSVSGITATVFGGNGFLGRYLIQRLARIGSQVVVPYRGDGNNTRHLQVMGDLGQLVRIPIDFADESTLPKTVERSNVVINLIGNMHQTKNYSYDDTHVKVVHRLCKNAKAAGGVKKFIHVSALNAAEDSPSEFLRSKWRGEQVVKEFFPDATILRPAPIFGHEDKLLNTMADLVNWFPVVPLVGDGQQHIQPIYVQDVAQCIVNALVDSEAPGKTFHLGGPDTYTREELMHFVCHEIVRPEAAVLPMPEKICKLYARAIEKFLPISWRMLSPDQVDQMSINMTVPETKGTLTCADLGVKPDTVSKQAATVLIRHRGFRDPLHNQFDHPKGIGRIAEF